MVLVLVLAGCSSRSRSNRDDAGIDAGQGPPTLDGGSLPAMDAGTDAAAAADGGPVVCNGTLCDLPPEFATEMDYVRPCCYENRHCGLHVVGLAGVTDRCLPYMTAGEPNADCPSTRQFTAYVYGCCLDDDTCGTSFAEGTTGQLDVGCVDPRALGRPAGRACDPAHTCKSIGDECGDDAECCQFAPATMCVSFGGEPATCRVPCGNDEQCETSCCRSVEGRDPACAPTELCTGGDSDGGT